MNIHPGDENLLQVGIGQLKIGAGSGRLHAVLGSCIGIAFIWKKGGRCGLAHCLLPEPRSDETIAMLGARYVSQAVPSLLRLMGAKECDYPDIDVVLAGGASMFASKRMSIGQDNAHAARKYLGLCGLNVHYCELGGKCGRQLLVDCARHSYSIKEINPTKREALHEHH